MDTHAHGTPLSPEQVFEESDKQLKKDTWLEALQWFEEQIGEDEPISMTPRGVVSFLGDKQKSANYVRQTLRSQIEEKRRVL